MRVQVEDTVAREDCSLQEAIENIDIGGPTMVRAAAKNHAHVAIVVNVIMAGVSGSAAFYAGIEKAKTIVAINTDIRAPIIKASDVAVIDDYKAVMAELAKIVLN